GDDAPGAEADPARVHVGQVEGGGDEVGHDVHAQGGEHEADGEHVEQHRAVHVLDEDARVLDVLDVSGEHPGRGGGGDHRGDGEGGPVQRQADDVADHHRAAVLG